MSSNAIIDIKVVPLNIGSTAGTAKPTPVPINASASLNGGTRDYEKLNNKPSINGVELIGNKTSADLGIDKTYIHHQNRASSEWSINHNMDAYPSVSVVDSAATHHGRELLHHLLRLFKLLDEAVNLCDIKSCAFGYAKLTLRIHKLGILALCGCHTKDNRFRALKLNLGLFCIESVESLASHTRHHRKNR